MNHDNEIHFFRKIPGATTTNALKWNYADTLMQLKVITLFAYKLFNPRAKPKAMLAARHIFATRYGSEGMQFVTPVYPSSCVCLVILSQFLLDSARLLRDSSAGKSCPFWWATKILPCMTATTLVKSREVKPVLNYTGIVGNDFAKFFVFRK